MKKNIKIASLVIIMLVSSCADDFDKINTNPNFPEKVTPELLMINVLNKTANRIAGEGLGDGSGLAQYLTRWDFNDSERFVFSGKTALWTELYFLIRDIDNMTVFAQDAGNDAYGAVGMIMKAYIGSILTDMWGDVPFSEANRAKSDGVFTSPYDEQQQIYTSEEGILDLLETADGILAATTSTISEANDIYFSGNLESWRKFANSLRLRYLLRISNVYSSAGSEMQSIVDNLPVFESIADNASLPYLANSPNQFPIFTWRDGDFNLIRMSNTIEQVLEDLGDTRVNVWFQPADTPINDDTDPVYNGMPVGLLEQTRATLGFTDLTIVSKIGTMFRDEPDAAEATLMNYSELQFILAEAANRGLISGGDAAAQAYYEEGIATSFEFWNTAMPANYLTQPAVAYNGSNALELIIQQKWLANFLVGFEGWLDFRRTGLPALPEPLDNTNSGEVPSRFFYPNEEQLLNTANWQEAVNRMGGSDNINTKVWWE